MLHETNQINAAGSVTASASHQGSHQSNRKSLKTLYATVFPVILLLVAVAVLIVLTVLNRPTIDDEFFVSDDTKTTISLTPSSNGSTNTTLIETHLVYTYDGDNVSGLKTYFEYPDEETARNTLESIKEQPEFKGAVVEGKYIVVTADEGQYKGLTTSDIRQQANALQKFQESQSSSKDNGAEAVNQEEQPREDDATNGSDDGSDGQ